MAHLFALWALAVAQPVYDLLGRYPEFFVARRTVSLELILLTVVLSCLAPAALAIPVALLRQASRRWFRFILLALVATLAAATILPIAGWLPLPDLLVLTTASAGGVGAALLYRGREGFRLFLSFLSPAALIFPVYFLWWTPVQRLAFPQGAEATTVAAPADSAEQPLSVAILVFDEMALFILLDEAGRIDAKRFPNFAELTAESIWFRNATTVAESTHQAIPSIATGLYPSPDKLGTSSDYPNNLFTWLSGTHRLEVFESITQLCPVQLCPPRVKARWSTRARLLAEDLGVVYAHLLLPPSLRRRLPDVSKGWGNFRRQDWQLQRSLAFYRDDSGSFEQLLEELAENRGPTLFFYHTAVPHFPWLLLPSGKRYSRSNLGKLFLNRDRWVQHQPVVSHAFQRYHLQLGFADRQLGKILEQMRASELLDRTVFWVMSDHGLNFIPGQPRRAGNTVTAAEIMPIPLWLRIPGGRQGVVSDLNVETVDILPSLADVLGMRLPWESDGISALDRAADKPSKRLYKQGREEPFHFAADLHSRIAPRICLAGEWFPTDTGRVVGAVDHVAFEDDRVIVAGFAADLANAAPADQILIFVDGRLAHTAVPSRKRPDVVEFFENSDLLESGFLLSLAPPLLPKDAEVRFFGRREGAVSELVYYGEYPWRVSSEADRRGSGDSNRQCDSDGDLPGFLVEQAVIPLEGREQVSDFYRQLQALAVSAGPDGVFRAGPGSEFFGEPLSALPAAAHPVSLTLAYPDDYEQVDPDSGFIPAEIDGTLDAAVLEEASVILVAINGIVQASAVPFPFNDTARILAIIPEDQFVPGENRLDFFALPRD